MRKLIFAAALSAITLTASAERMCVTFGVPLTCQKCENRIKGNIRFEKGVKKIETSVPAQTVKVEYDDTKTSPEKLQKALEKLGYEAEKEAVAPVKK